MYCKVLAHLSNVTCMLITDGETYEVRINDDVVPLQEWGFPEVINSQVIYALSSFLAIARLCEGVNIGRSTLPVSKSCTVQCRNGDHYLKHVRCPVVLPILTKGMYCSSCRSAHVLQIKAKANASKVSIISFNSKMYHLFILRNHKT